MVLLAPSILAADFRRLQEQVEAADAAGADWFHLDVMDGHFVPNISFGPLVVAALRKVTQKCLDVHLMISKPDDYLEAFARAGADRLTVHVETCPHLHRTIQAIKDLGIAAGVALNPATPVCAVEPILAEVDLVLAMSVNPGFGGQRFIPATLGKLQQLSRLIEQCGRDIRLQVDGGIDKDTTPEAVAAGADVLVAGSAVFGSSDIAAALAALRSAAQKPSPGTHPKRT